MEKLKQILVIMTLLIFVNQAKATITDVDIVPEVPTFADTVTISAYGIETHFCIIDDSNFLQVGKTLQLDIFVTHSLMLPGSGDWEHYKSIGTLAAGIYDLQVNEFGRPSKDENYILIDTYPTSFEVVPEPASLAFLILGLPAMRLFLKRKSNPVKIVK